MRCDLTFFGSNKRLRRLSLTFQDQNTWFQEAARRLKSSVLVFLDTFYPKQHDFSRNVSSLNFGITASVFLTRAKSPGTFLQTEGYYEVS